MESIWLALALMQQIAKSLNIWFNISVCVCVCVHVLVYVHMCVCVCGRAPQLLVVHLAGSFKT